MADIVLIPTSGKGIITNRIKGSGSEPNYLGWGTGTTAPAASDTGLQTPRAEARVQGASSQQTTNVSNDTYQVAATLTCAGSAAAITELGLFDASSAGNLFLRTTFSPINLNVGDSIQFTVKTVLS